MIKAICFDLDGVYFTETGFKKFKEEIQSLSPKEVNTDEVFHGGMMNKFKLGQISEQEYWDYVNLSTDLNFTVEEYSILIAKNYEVNLEVKNYIAEIRAKGILSCVCSNNFVSRVAALNQKFNFLADFDVAVFSYEVGITKPDKRIFETLIDRTRVKPSEIVYSDDNADKLQGAKELGINAFVFEGFEKFIASIEKI